MRGLSAGALKVGAGIRGIPFLGLEPKATEINGKIPIDFSELWIRPRVHQAGGCCCGAKQCSGPALLVALASHKGAWGQGCFDLSPLPHEPVDLAGINTAGHRLHPFRG